MSNNTNNQKEDPLHIGCGIIILIVMMALLISVFSSSDSNSKKSWNDLNDVEKSNAKWAYEAQQYIDSLD